MKLLPLFFTIVAVCCSYTAGKHTGQQPLKVLTYNIHHANPPEQKDVIDVAGIAAVINKTNPDLVALQELDVNNKRSGRHLNQAAALAQLTGMHYFFAKGIDFLDGEYGIAILSKYPFKKSHRYALPMKEGSGGEPRALAVVEIEPVKGRRIAFLNTHLDLYEQNRLLQADYILDVIKKLTVPVIFCGDLNAEPGSAVISKFTNHLQTKYDEGPTYPQTDPQSRLDYIMFTPKQIELKDQRLIEERKASDHLPVYAELLLKN